MYIIKYTFFLKIKSNEFFIGVFNVFIVSIKKVIGREKKKIIYFYKIVENFTIFNIESE